jgi:hypothetical protein
LITPRLALSSSFAYDHICSYIVPRERVPFHGGTGVRILPGHGEPADANLLYAQRDYLRRLLDAVDAPIDAEAFLARMKAGSPGFGGEGFQLAMTAKNREALLR